MVIRPSLKFIKLSYVVTLLMFMGLGVWIGVQAPTGTGTDWRLYLFAVPVLIDFFTVFHHMQRMLVKITILGDRLRYEGGLFSKSTRTMELEKVQDVRVDQTFFQRMVNIGDLSLETAGGASRLEMDGIDNPQSVADHILSLAQQQRKAAATGGISAPSTTSDS